MFGLMKEFLKQPFKKFVHMKPDELRALGLAFVFNFIVLGSYS